MHSSKFSCQKLYLFFLGHSQTIEKADDVFRFPLIGFGQPVYALGIGTSQFTFFAGTQFDSPTVHLHMGRGFPHCIQSGMNTFVPGCCNDLSRSSRSGQVQSHISFLHFVQNIIFRSGYLALSNLMARSELLKLSHSMTRSSFLKLSGTMTRTNRLELSTVMARSQGLKLSTSMARSYAVKLSRTVARSNCLAHSYGLARSLFLERSHVLTHSYVLKRYGKMVHSTMLELS